MKSKKALWKSPKLLTWDVWGLVWPNDMLLAVPDHSGCQVGFLIFLLIETFFKIEFHGNLLPERLLYFPFPFMRCTYLTLCHSVALDHCTHTAHTSNTARHLAPTGPGRPHSACSTSSWHLPRWLPAQLFCVPKDTNGTPAGPGLISDKGPTQRSEAQPPVCSTLHVVLSKHNTPWKCPVCPLTLIPQTIPSLLRSGCRPRTRHSSPGTPCTHTLATAPCPRVTSPGWVHCRWTTATTHCSWNAAPALALGLSSSPQRLRPQSPAQHHPARRSPALRPAAPDGSVAPPEAVPVPAAVAQAPPGREFGTRRKVGSGCAACCRRHHVGLLQRGGHEEGGAAAAPGGQRDSRQGEQRARGGRTAITAGGRAPRRPSDVAGPSRAEGQGERGRAGPGRRLPAPRRPFLAAARRPAPRLWHRRPTRAPEPHRPSLAPGATASLPFARPPLPLPPGRQGLRSGPSAAPNGTAAPHSPLSFPCSESVRSRRTAAARGEIATGCLAGVSSLRWKMEAPLPGVLRACHGAPMARGCVWALSHWRHSEKTVSLCVFNKELLET